MNRRQTDDFEKRFWSGLDLAKLYETASTRPERTGAQERMFVAGMNEFLKMPDRPADDVLSGVRRSMNATFQREMDALEKGLPMLASIGSVSPYIACSAPSGASWTLLPVCRALKTCLWPLSPPVLPKRSLPQLWACLPPFPATAAYNLFPICIERLSNRFDSFSEEFLNILAHQR